MCSSKTQWVTRHLRQAHQIGKDEALQLLVHTDWYRRRSSSEPGIKVRCIVDGCHAVVIRLNVHLRRIHKISSPEIHEAKRDNKKSMRVIQVPNVTVSNIPSSSISRDVQSGITLVSQL